MAINQSDIREDNNLSSEESQKNIGHSTELYSTLKPMVRQNFTIPRDEEYRLINELRSKNDPLSQRIVRYYDMPDLSRTKDNPVEMITERFKNINIFKDFDIIETPEIVGVYETFDLFNFREDHPARSKSDTYYVTEDKILRTHFSLSLSSVS